MEKELSEKIVKELLEKKGKARGDLLLAHLRYIQRIYGDKGKSAVENKLNEIGVDLKKLEINTFTWYPVGYEPLIILAAKETFKWDDEEVFKMGKNIIKLSLIIKLMLPLFVSIDKVFEKSPKFWKNNYDFGEVEPVGREGGTYILRIKDYDIHPISCIYNAGHIIGLAEMAGRKGMTIEEKVCTHRGGGYHEYHIK